MSCAGIMLGDRAWRRILVQGLVSTQRGCMLCLDTACVALLGSVRLPGSTVAPGSKQRPPLRPRAG